MPVLDSTSLNFKAKLDTAPALPIHILVDYEEVEVGSTNKPRHTDLSTNPTKLSTNALTTILAAPASSNRWRTVTEVSAYNPNVSIVPAAFSLVSGSTVKRTKKFNLKPGLNLEFIQDNGWRGVDGCASLMVKSVKCPPPPNACSQLTDCLGFTIAGVTDGTGFFGQSPCAPFNKSYVLKRYNGSSGIWLSDLYNVGFNDPHRVILTCVQSSFYPGGGLISLAEHQLVDLPGVPGSGAIGAFAYQKYFSDWNPTIGIMDLIGSSALYTCDNIPATISLLPVPCSYSACLVCPTVNQWSVTVSGLTDVDIYNPAAGFNGTYTLTLFYYDDGSYLDPNPICEWGFEIDPQPNPLYPDFYPDPLVHYGAWIFVTDGVLMSLVGVYEGYQAGVSGVNRVHFTRTLGPENPCGPHTFTAADGYYQTSHGLEPLPIGVTATVTPVL